ncbi:MAG: hypothetical protein LBV04_06700 [Deferribacteraceae bacterium]|nr:hypothetical protein [Deferribacteraceae bacterium]
MDNLYQELDCLLSELTDSNYIELLERGRELIIASKKSGAERQEVYDKLLPLYKHYLDADEHKADLIGDWLDMISGWCQKAYCIWD